MRIAHSDLLWQVIYLSLVEFVFPYGYSRVTDQVVEKGLQANALEVSYILEESKYP